MLFFWMPLFKVILLISVLCVCAWVGGCEHTWVLSQFRSY